MDTGENSSRPIMQKEDYFEPVYTAAKMMIRFKKPHHLIKRIVNYIVDYFKLSYAGAFFYDKRRNSYVFVQSKGVGIEPPPGLIKLTPNSPLIRFFTDTRTFPSIPRDYLTLTLIDSLLADKESLKREQGLEDFLTDLKEELRILRKAQVCIPCYSKRKSLLGGMLLGETLSGEIIGKKQIKLFVTLSSDAAMALEHAQLIDDKIHAYRKLEKAHEQLEKAHKELELAFEKIEISYDELVEIANNIMSVKDEYTGNHLRDSEELGEAVARDLIERLGLDIDLWAVKKASRLHDIGKAEIESKILQKKGPLTQEERSKMQQHAELGARILAPSKHFEKVAEIIRQHHERLDGTGYPRGLKKGEILIEALIVSAVDSYLAMISQRPYNKVKTPLEAIAEMKRNVGTQFDGEVVTSLNNVLIRRGVIKEEEREGL